MTQVGNVSQARTGPMPTGGQYGWYRDHEGNEYQRATNLLKFVETDTYQLDLWFRRQVAEGLAIRDDLVLAVKAMGRPDPVSGWSSEDKRKLNSIAKDAMQAAKQADGARKGTAVHDLTERLDRGESIESVVRGLPAGPAQSLRAYDFLRRENGWRSVEIERTVVCDELQVAGTFDRIDLIPGLASLLGQGDCQYGHAAAGLPHDPGPDTFAELPVVNDVKTEKDPTLNGLHIAPQQAIYSRAKRMWRPVGGLVPLLDSKGEPKTYGNGDVITVPNGEYVPAPCVRQDVAVITHIIDGAAEPMFVNLTEGWAAARAARAQADRQARSKRRYGSAGAWFVAMPNVKRPRVAEMLVAQAASQDRMNGHALPGVMAPSSVMAQAQVGEAADTVVEQLAPAQLQSAINDAVRTQQAVRDGATGMVSWQPTAEPPIGTQVEVAGVQFTKVDSMDNIVQHGALDEVDRSAIQAVWAAVALDGPERSLAAIYEIYTGTVGRPWTGRVAEAAEARRQQIACPQRELHSAQGAQKCACSWTAGVPA